jgi:hypothetical protein
LSKAAYPGSREERILAPIKRQSAILRWVDSTTVAQLMIGIFLP